MNIRPWRELEPHASRELIGLIMGTYFGGRAEAHLRRIICQVLYCDFLSMYPTVCTLMGLWRFVIAKGMISGRPRSQDRVDGAQCSRRGPASRRRYS
jgi:hypothetical protein